MAVREKLTSSQKEGGTSQVLNRGMTCWASRFAKVIRAAVETRMGDTKLKAGTPTVRTRQERGDGGQTRAMTPGMREIIQFETIKMKMQSLAATHQIQSKACGCSSRDSSHIGAGPAKK